MLYFSAILLGLLGGFISGFTGLGGGIVFVPSLLFLMQAQGYDPASAMMLATGTSLGAVTLAAFSSVYRHRKMGNVSYRTFFPIVIGVIISSAIGVKIANIIGGNVLRYLFIIFTAWAAVRMFQKVFKNPLQHNENCKTANELAAISAFQKILLFLLGMTVGIQSAMLGVGGGTLVVPVLVALLGYPARHAVGTSASVAFSASLIGVFFRALLGEAPIDAPAGTIGTMNISLALLMGIPGIFSAQIGAIAHQRLGELRWFYLLFGLLLLFVTIRIVL